MASPYAQPSGSSGSVYAQPSATSGSSYSAPAAPVAAAKPSGGGGFWHEVLHNPVTHAVGQGAHVVAEKAALAGHDIASIPGGVYQVVNTGAVQPWKDVLTTGHVSAAHNKAIDKLSQQMIDSTAQAINHPLRDPFQTATLLAPAAHIPFRAVEMARGVDITAPRLLKAGETEVNLNPPSRNAALRAAQTLHDTLVQRSLNANKDVTRFGVTGRVARYGERRIHGALEEAARPQRAMRNAPADALERAGKELRGNVKQHVPFTGKMGHAKLAEAALRLTSENSTAEEAAAAHRYWAGQGIAPRANLKLARMYDEMAQHQVVHVRSEAQAQQVLREYRDLERKVTAGEQRVESTYGPADISTMPHFSGGTWQDWSRRRGYTAQEIADFQKWRNINDRLGITEPDSFPTPEHPWGMSDEGIIKAASRVEVNAARYPRLAQVDQMVAQAQQRGEQIVREHNLMTAEGQKVRTDLPGQIRRAAATEGDRGGRSIYGPEGRGFVTAKVTEAKYPKAPVRGSRSPVIGEAKSPIGGPAYEGTGMIQGKLPDNTTRLVAQHLRDLNQFVNTDEIRRRWLETGSTVRRTNRDILVREPGTSKGDISAELGGILGRNKLTLDELRGTQGGLREALQGHIDHILGRDDPEVARAERYAIGEQAPKGYKWVSKDVVGRYGNSFAGSRGRPGRFFDNVNSAITAATVYFKVGHVGTRVLTNAATNIIGGSASPLQVFGKTVPLWRSLSWEDRVRALAASGQHGFLAMPHEGAGAIGKIARVGANWWAKHADAPFRFNAVAYYARKAGYDTPDKFRQFLDHVENPTGLPAEERARVENVTKLANRESIAYDRLNETENRFITRGIWFYPWVKGSSVYTARTLVEHPFKAAVGGALGAQGRQAQQAQLGPVPSYENGLFRVGGSATLPQVADFSTFSPFATFGSLLQLPEYSAAAENLSPAAAALLALATRTDQYGQHTNHPVTAALTQLLSPTPEFQIGKAASGGSGKMFPSTNPTLTALYRALLGPGMPRRANRAVLNKSAGREKSGK